jgi:hypothetical protein
MMLRLGSGWAERDRGLAGYGLGSGGFGTVVRGTRGRLLFEAARVGARERRDERRQKRNAIASAERDEKGDRSMIRSS